MFSGIKIKKLLFDGSIRGDAVQIYLAQSLSLGVGLISSVIIARTLGPSNKGIFDLFNLINSFIVELGFLGFGSGLLYYLANKRQPLHEVHGTGLVFSLGAGLLTAAVGWLGLKYWELVFPGLNKWILLSAFFSAPFLYYRLVWTNIITGINRAVSVYKLALTLSAANLTVIIVLQGMDLLNIQNVIGLTIAVAVLTAVLCFGLLYRQQPDIHISTSLMKKSLQYGFTIYIGNIANVLHFKIDQAMINYWLGTKAVGIYAISVNWAEMLFILDSGILAAALYKISSTTPEESNLLALRLFRVQVVLSGVSGFFLALLAYPLLLFLYGENFREAALPLILLIPGIIAWSASKVVSNMLIYNMGLASFVIKVAIAGMLLNIFLNYSLIKIVELGINGASISSSLSYFMVALIIRLKAKTNESTLSVSNKTADRVIR